MADERTGFESWLEDVFEHYSDRAPVEVDPWAVTRAAARSAAPGWRSRIAWLTVPRVDGRAWVRLTITLAILGLLLVVLAMAMWVGGQRHEPSDVLKTELPNADLVAVTDGRDRGLYLRDMATGEVRSLAPDASGMRYQGALFGAIDGRAAWSPTRAEIAYFAKGGSLRVVRVSDGTSREVARTEPLSQPWGYLELLAWSPDGAWIVTPTIPGWTPGTEPTFTTARSGLMLVNVEEPSRSMVLSSDEATAPVFGQLSEGEPALDWSAGDWSLVGWSPSGRSLALAYRNGPVGEERPTPPYVVLVDAAGSGSRAIRLPEAVSYAAWIDEEHLLVKPFEPEDSSRGSLSMLDLTSGRMTQLVPDPTDDPQADDLLPSFPAVSPDRSLIAFYAAVGYHAPVAHTEPFGLVVIDPEGEVLHRIEVDRCPLGPNMVLDFSASGRQVLMQCGRERWRVADLDTAAVRDVNLGFGFESW